ncbi:MAG: hypothetical protein IID30_11620 [Planctomycetes bacterium]|nr:hypothetical protein [Planctomycetota bacterium]
MARHPAPAGLRQGIKLVFDRKFGPALMILIVNITIALIVIWLLTQAFN